MARERINIIKSAYRTNEIDRVVDKEFKTFTKPVEAVDTDTIEELEGESNSHQYLLQKSSELVDLEKSTEDIQPLLDEIGQLRQQLLDANQQLFELENGQEGI